MYDATKSIKSPSDDATWSIKSPSDISEWSYLAATWRPRRFEERRGGRRYYLLGSGEREAAVPIPEVDACLVLHLTPDRCAGYPIRADEEVFDAFLYTLEVFRWMNDISKTVMEPPLEVATA